MNSLTKIQYHTPTIQDHKLITDYLKRVHEFGCEYTFANLFLWAKHYDLTFSLVENVLVFRSHTKQGYSYGYPIGEEQCIKQVLWILMEQTIAEGDVFRMHGVTIEKINQLEAWFPGKFCFTPDRDAFDYLYDISTLISLQGKKYHGKRNHINRFIAEHADWSYEPIQPQNMMECLELARDWCEKNGCDDEGHFAEFCVIQQAFKYFEQLNLVGGVLRTDGKVVAFTLGEALNEEVFVVHIEKAYTDIQGAYPMMNREFLKHAASDYCYVNREEDLGLEGLRKAKLSYRPVRMVEKHLAVYQSS